MLLLPTAYYLLVIYSAPRWHAACNWGSEIEGVPG